jgi:tetratricopeptide (TPR) repeat protein
MRTAALSSFLVLCFAWSTFAQSIRCQSPLDKGFALEKAGQKSEAAGFFNKAIQACTPAKSDAEKQALAKAHIRVGVFQYGSDPAEAMLHFRKAVESDPSNLAGSLDLAASLIALQSYREAITVAESAIERGSEDKDLLGQLEYNAGLGLLKLCVSHGSGCDQAKMEKHFQRSAELKPEFADTYFNLAAITNDVHHDSRAAMALFKKACDLGHQQGCMQYAHFKSQLEAH